MKNEIQVETIKAVPAVGGTSATIYAHINDLNWETIAAQVTVIYVVLQILYLLWKWTKEYKNT